MTTARPSPFTCGTGPDWRIRLGTEMLRVACDEDDELAEDIRKRYYQRLICDVALDEMLIREDADG